MDFCGFRVSTYTDGLSPDVQKIDAVTRIPPPSSATSKYFWEPHAGCQLVQFEMIRNLYLRKQYEHWYRRFVPQYAMHSGEAAPGKRT